MHALLGFLPQNVVQTLQRDSTKTKKVQEAGRVRTLGWHYNVYNSHAHPHWYYWVLSEAPTAADTEGQKESLFRAPFLPFFCHYYQRWQLFDLTQLLLRILRTTGYFLQNLIKTRKLNNVLKQPVSKKMRKSLLFLFNTLIQPISTFLKNLFMIFKNYNLTKYDSTHLWSQHVGGRGKQVFLSSMPAYLHRKFQTNKDLRSRSQKKTNNKNRTQYKS